MIGTHFFPRFAPAVLALLFPALAGCTGASQQPPKKTPLSKSPFGFPKALLEGPKTPLPGTRFWQTSDRAKIAYRLYPAATKNSKMVLLFYHGGGAHQAAGYQILARELAENFHINMITPDLRGHGLSSGARGDAPSPQRVWKDIDLAITQLRTEFPKAEIYLGGHSSGAGLLLNHATATQQAKSIAGYIFLAPHFGFRSETSRPDNPRPFARVRVWPFVLNSMSFGGLFGHYPAIRFQYPDSILKQSPGLVSSNTVNMANALTPSDPEEQFKAIASKSQVWLAGRDELIDPARLSRFLKKHGPARRVKQLPVTHLGILTKAAGFVGPALISEATSGEER